LPAFEEPKKDVLVFEHIDIARITLDAWSELTDALWHFFESYRNVQIAFRICKIGGRSHELRVRGWSSQYGQERGGSQEEGCHCEKEGEEEGDGEGEAEEEEAGEGEGEGEGRGRGRGGQRQWSPPTMFLYSTSSTMPSTPVSCTFGSNRSCEATRCDGCNGKSYLTVTP